MSAPDAGWSRQHRTPSWIGLVNRNSVPPPDEPGKRRTAGSKLGDAPAAVGAVDNTLASRRRHPMRLSPGRCSSRHRTSFECAAQDRRLGAEVRTSTPHTLTAARSLQSCSAAAFDHACAIHPSAIDPLARRPGSSGDALRGPAVSVRQCRHGGPGSAVHPRVWQAGAGARRAGEARPGAACTATVMRPGQPRVATGRRHRGHLDADLSGMQSGLRLQFCHHVLPDS